ncbi:LytR/AlgR family response regulator transcription factor [Luxibacter massiliensis]|uniref:LytR/AlgR family response regulator transcription factor n=1 Tax=Luxibacter massiliensis TaxID=2219695 RepID=UPI000F05F2E3|nr:LytTR family DNA-binding domain-containing protein [Luxibacter massiliensis]
MVKIAVCDDNVNMAAELEALLLEIETLYKIDMDIDIFFDGKTLCNSIELGNKYDMIYLDIRMKEVNGISAAKKIREKDLDTILIYVSSYDSYLKQLFEVQPFRFLDKPVDRERFCSTFIKAYQKIMDNSIFFQYKFNKEIYRVPVKEIMYFESDNRVIHLVMETRIDRFYGKLNVVEEWFRNSKMVFLRIHQSYLVNFTYIKCMGFTKLELFNGKVLPISDERQKKIRDKYCSFIGGELS